MSINPLNHVIINKKIGGINERRAEYCQEGLRRIGYQSIRVGKTIRCWNISHFRMEKRKNSKDGRVSIETYVRKQRATKSVTKNKRNVGDNSTNKIKYTLFSIKQEKMLYFFLILEYNPIMLKGMKGFKMSTKNTQQQKSHLKKLVMGSEIEHGIEWKLRGVYALLDALEMADSVQPTAFNALANMVLDSIKDLEALRVRVDYMFGCAVDGEVA